MKILVTGAQGFIGKNLVIRLKELKTYDIIEFHRDIPETKIYDLIAQADFIFHLAGINRPQTEVEFKTGNADLTQTICNAIEKLERQVPLVFTSSSQAVKDNPYGISKKMAEEAIEKLAKKKPAFYYRLPNVFGKWSKPNYNSAVATFCYNVANDLPLQINDPAVALNLVYVDDVVTSLIDLLKKYEQSQLPPEVLQTVEPVYATTVGKLADQIKAFKKSRSTLITEDVGTGLIRALHATYLSFLKPEQFSYSLTQHADPRGVFVEMLKTKTAGQISFFTAHPGITRGGHYHHTKTEKFLVIKGQARYKFRHLVTNEFFELVTDASEAKVVETIPGWSHDITNIGNEELIVMLWANEIFDRQKPDTVSHEV